MSNLHVQYLLVGGGVAASAAAEAIRQRDAAGSILLIGQEQARPYHRPPLSKAFLRDEISRDSLFTHPGDWFARNHIELHTGHRVSAIDINHRQVVLDSGSEIGFEKLLLAVGASPIMLDIPGAQLPNVFYLRTLGDGDRLRTSIEQAKRVGRPHDGPNLPRPASTGRGRVAIIGGGLLGVELAASLTRLGLAVDLICASPTLWDNYAGDVTGRFIARLLEHQCVTVHLSTAAVRLEGDGRVQRVVLSSGRTIDADLAIGAVGIAVNRHILRDTSIRAEKAILTDEHGQTNVPGIYAAGDCAAILDTATGKYRIAQHWTHAQLTGRIAGDHMAGGDARYEAVPTFDSEIFGLNIRVIGEARQVTRRLIRGTPNVDAPNFLEIGLSAAGEVVQIIAVGHEHDPAKFKSMIRDRLTINGNEEQMKDPASDL